MPDEPELPEPEFTQEQIIKQVFLRDPVLQRELDDHATAQGWLKPIDLLTVPVAEWERCINHYVAIPPTLAAFFEGQPTFTKSEVQSMEEAIERYYGVAEPYYITIQDRDVLLGKEPTK